jgi:mono/diheme cytochrome c family protein
MKLFRRIPLELIFAVELALVMTVLPLVTASAQTPAGSQAPAAGQGGQGRGARGGNGPGGRGGGGGGARGGVGTTPAPTSPVTGNAVTGKKLYFDYSCYACHGFNGETGARAFVGNWGNLQTEAGFTAFLRLRADQAPETPATRMPNYPQNTLSDQQAKDIYAYIRTFKSNSPEAKDIPTLNAIVGAASRPYKP